ncbi:MAG: hypothetical protein MI919_16365 [Holophagales bacterium]|nr:hypothetical protein [Holophagales bacterium]
MRSSIATHLGLVVLALAFATAPLQADDLFPPDYRFDPLSTVAGWDFLTEQNPDAILPDDPAVPLVVGDAKPLLDSAFPAGAPHPSGALFGDVEYSAGGYRGGPGGDGGIVFNVPNWIDQEPEKRLRLQITYRGVEPPTAVFGFLGVPGTSDGVEELFVERRAATDPSLPPGASYFFEDWKMFPNPDWEQVVVFLPEGSFVDQVVIDTVSGPLTIPTLIFRDGFESGNTARWSSAQP